MLNPNIVLNQNVAASVDASNHKSPIKKLFILFIICLLLYHIYDKVKRTMMDKSEIFAEVKDNLAMWCADSCSGADLAAAAGVTIENNLRAISVVPTAIEQLWAWLEKTNVKILGRFYIDSEIDDVFMSDFATRVNMSFHAGADGAIVFMHRKSLDEFVANMSYVRDDLFFNKILSVGLDINEIDYDDWKTVFALLNTLRVDALTLFLSNDDGDKSDFVGRIYSMLESDMGDWHGMLYFVPGKNVARIDQFYRLTEQIRTGMAQKMLFLVNND